MVKIQGTCTQSSRYNNLIDTLGGGVVASLMVKMECMSVFSTFEHVKKLITYSLKFFIHTICTRHRYIFTGENILTKSLENYKKYHCNLGECVVVEVG